MIIHGRKTPVRLILEPLLYLTLVWIAFEAILYMADSGATLTESYRTRSHFITLGGLLVACIIIAKLAIFKHLAATPTTQIDIAPDALTFDGKVFLVNEIQQLKIWAPTADSHLFTLKLSLASGKEERVLSGRHRLGCTLREFVGYLPEQLNIELRQPPLLRWVDKLRGRTVNLSR